MLNFIEMIKRYTHKPRITATGDQCFWVNNGPVLQDVQELNEAFKTMTDAQFMHHVSKGKNDFASWVADVLEDNDLASLLRKSRTRKSAARAVEVHVKNYYS